MTIYNRDNRLRGQRAAPSLVHSTARPTPDAT
jgi:hypothetical protein